jgi:2-methylcitrate dehydratase PrpD
MSIIGELIGNLIETRFAQFDDIVLEKAKERVIDVIGCTIGGSDGPGCRPLIDLVLDWGGKQEATILVHGKKLPAGHAAMVNSVMARSYDFEPAGPIVEGKSTPAHLSGTTVPTALAVSEQIESTGKEFLGALILGDDLASRIIAASNLNIDSGWDCTGTANAFGAVAIASRLYGLNEQQTLNAFGIVINQMAGTFQNIFDAVHTFKLPQGLASRDGIFSAELAKKGFTGVRDPLFSNHGYFSLYTQSCSPEYLTKNLGRAFCADQTFKPYPCCRSNHAAIECVLDLVTSNDIDLDKIERVSVDVSSKAFNFAVGQPFKIRDVPQIDAAFSLQYTVASTLLRKSVRLEHFTNNFILEPEIMELVKKIALSPNLPSSAEPNGAVVKIMMNNGETFEKSVAVPKGSDIFTPLTKDEKREKFLENTYFSNAIPLEQAKKALTVLDRLEDVKNMRDVVNMFVP